MNTYPVSRKANLVVQEMDSELLIYDLTENKAFCLNETSALIWQLCDGNKSVDEISKIIGQQLNSPANEDIVWFALDQLKKEKLIENEEELGNYFAGMSRREVIKKVGLGSVIALPIVAGLIAPVSLQAQSCANQPQNTPGCSNNGNVNCMTNTDCCSCNCMISNGNCVT
jgi:hypothetical protein